VDDTLRALGGVEWQAWEYTTIFPRHSALIGAIAAQLSLTEEQIDQMFLAAAAISV
jgi:response regulator RpfG family c-di-GMP phosphodiesterase